MKKTAIILMFIILLSKATGFLREVSLSYFFGTTNISDAYIVAFTIPSLIFYSFIGVAMVTGYVPVFNEVLLKRGYKESIRYTNNILNILLLTCSILIIVIIALAEPVVNIFASGFDVATLSIAVRLTKIMIFSIYFIGFSSILTSFLQINKQFVLPACVGLLMNLIKIIFIAIAFMLRDIDFLAIGIVIAYASQLVLILPAALRNGFRYFLHIDMRDVFLWRTMKIGVPAIAGRSADSINILVGRTFASSIAIGGISAINYSTALCDAVYNVFTAAISTVMYPTISRKYVEGDLQGFSSNMKMALLGVSVMVFPCAIGLVVLAEPVVGLLFGRGAFDEQSVKLTAQVLTFYAGGMVAYSWRDILTSVFYAMQAAHIPARNAIISMVINVILIIMLTSYYGIVGIPIATSMAAFITAFLLIFELRKYIIGLNGLYISVVKICFATVIMGITARLVYAILGGYFEQYMSVAMTIVVGLMTYVVIIASFKITEVENIFRSVILKLSDVKTRND